MRISNLIKCLEHIKENEGDLNVYIWSDGITKMIGSVVKRETYDGETKGCFIEL